MKISSRFVIGLCAAGVCACSSPAPRTPAAASTVTPPAVQASSLQTPSVLLEPESPAPSAATQKKSAAREKTVRVLLAENAKSVYVKHSGTVQIYTQDKTKQYKISQPGTVAVKTHKNGQVQVGTLIAAQAVWIEPVGTTKLEIDKNTYTGMLKVLPGATTFSLVEYVPLETYLTGVLPYEMHPNWPLEALKAQAVAARTYTLKSIEKKADEPFDLYPDVRSQVYKGVGNVQENVQQAVAQTRGEVLTYQGNVFFTYYHANCGGGTDHVHVWNTKAADIKPLGGASCSFDSHSKSHQFKQDISKSAAERFARSVGLKGSLKSIKIAKKTNTGRAVLLTLKTSGGSKTVPCANFRAATGIRSCKLTKITTGTTKVHVEGRGYGHGIGMCQDGAHGMALKKHTYKQILKHYYPGSILSKEK